MPLDLALQNPSFMPAVRDISAITNAFPAVVTTTFAHGYDNGSIVRLYIPKSFGMQQVNFMKAPITILSPTTFSIALDTTHADPFVVPSLYPGFNIEPAQSVPVGEETETLQNAFVNILTPLF